MAGISSIHGWTKQRSKRTHGHINRKIEPRNVVRSVVRITFTFGKREKWLIYW
jgi:hypothetical protein